jgi:KDO2-lipid IV(A) lauroyltransferase
MFLPRMKSEPAASLLRLSLLPAWAGIGFLWLLHWLPLPLQAALGNALGWLLALIPGRRKRIVATNLTLCFPDTPEAVRRRWLRQTFQASMRATLEHGLLWWGSEARLRRLIRIDNPEAAMGDGVRPVIWLAPHFVGLDMGGARLSMDRQAASMYAPARNPVSDKLMLRGRSRFFSPILISKGDGIKPVLKVLKRGLPFYYLPDQDHGRLNAVFVPFFGIPAATVSALPRLVRLTNAQVVPVIARLLPGGQGYRVRFYPPWDNFPSDDLEADVARMNAFIEERVREMPPQYLWLHRRFKTRPAGEPSLYE